MDSVDEFPDDATESTDSDSDGVGNNADTDDDNDGFSDIVETAAGTSSTNANDYPHLDLSDSIDAQVW